ASSRPTAATRAGAPSCCTRSRSRRGGQGDNHCRLGSALLSDSSEPIPHAAGSGSAACPEAGPVGPTRAHLRTLGLSALGGALEFYDFVIFVFFATTMGALFFPADMPGWLRLVQTFGIFAAGYLARPLGGIVLAHFGDLLGRKRMFLFSILLMAVPTLLIGLLPTYATVGIAAPLLLLLLRIAQGAAIGGEAPG